MSRRRVFAKARLRLSSFNNLSFCYKLLIPIGVLVALFIYMAVNAIVETNHLGRQVRQVATTELPGVTLLLEADRDIHRAQIAERGMIFVDVESDTFAEMRASHAENVRQAHDRIDQFIEMAESAGLTSDSALAGTIADYQRLRDERERLTAEVVENRASNARGGRGPQST